MKDLRNITILIVVLGFAICAAFIVPYWIKFGNTSLNNDPNVWGVFGDYFGGTINPILSLINISLLIVISVYVARFDTHRQFNEYRYKAYLKLCSMFDDSSDTPEQIGKLYSAIEIYSFNNQFLFPKKNNTIFNGSIQQLLYATKQLRKIKLEFEQKVNTGEIQVIHLESYLGFQLEEALANWPSPETDETKALRQFSDAKKHLLGFIQAVMVEGNVTKFKLQSPQLNVQGEPLKSSQTSD